MSTQNQPLNITLEAATQDDYFKLAQIEAATYDADDFSVVAFGPHRHSHENLTLRAKAMAHPSPTVRDMTIKAVLHDPVTGNSEIIAFASWAFVTSRDLAAEQAQEAEEKARRESMTPEQRQHEDDEMWGPGADVKFCEEAFGRADDVMYGSCEGKGYCKLRTLAVEPAYQRRGIGSKLMEQGLAEADRLGLQCILGASPEGEGLYERYGFRLVEVMGFKLWEYEGGGEERMKGNIARHVVMRRPPQVDKKVDVGVEA